MIYEEYLSKIIKKRRERYSTYKKLKDSNRLPENLELLIHSITLEELIALKLELSNKLLNYKLGGLPILALIDKIVKNAVFTYVLSITDSATEAAHVLGTSRQRLYYTLKEFGISENIIENFKNNKTALKGTL